MRLLGALALGLSISVAGPFAAATAVASPPAPAAASRPVLVVLGDSLSAGYGIRVEEGWVALLGRRLEAEGYGYRVVNASVSGETTGGALARLPRVLAVQNPSLLIVELGANDGLRGLPIAEMRDNLDRLVELAARAGVRVLLVGMRMPGNYGPQYTQQFFDTFGTVAKRHKVALVPFLLERIAQDDQNFQADRMHPVAAAQAALLETVWTALKPLLGAHPVARRPANALAAPAQAQAPR
jgi:acyl-CoA thioesterase-1